MTEKTTSHYRKRRQRDVTPAKPTRVDRHTQSKSPVGTKSPGVDSAFSAAKSSLSQWQILFRICMITLVIFLGGLFFTTISVELIGYRNLPNLGEIVQRDNGSIVFQEYYPVFRRLAIVDTPGIAGSDNYLNRVGMLGTGIFFYAVLNAPHWIFEINFRNIGALFLVPFFSVLIGSFFFYFYLIPSSMQTSQRAVSLPSLIGLLHAGFMSLVVVAAYLFKPDFSILFSNLSLYSGQIIGRMLPGVYIMLLTGILYGAIAGGILSVIHKVRGLYHQVID